MRIGLALLLLLHGLAHLVGFLTPWGLAPAVRSAPAITPLRVLFGGRLTLGDDAWRGFGLLWLAVAFGFAVAAVATGLGASWSITAVIGVALISLLMTLAWWPATRAGAAVNVLILAVLGAMGVAGFRGDMARAAERISRSTIIQTAAGPIEYATFGAGVPVLALHGTAGGWDQAAASAADLAPLGYRVIAPSRFGYLRTPWRAGASPALEADTWVMLLDSLRVDRVAVLSWSAGAAPAIQLALRHPDRVTRLVFFVPGAGGILPPEAVPPMWVVDATFRWDFPIWAAHRLMPGLMRKWVAVPDSLVPSLAPADRAVLEQAITALFPVSKRHDGMMYDARSQSGEFGLYPIERVPQPTLWISADDDMYRTLRVARHAAGAIPGARLLRYESGGHLLLGRAADLWPRVDRFLRDSL